MTMTDAEIQKLIDKADAEREEKSITRMCWVKSLMDFGHSADKALEIAIDCERGDQYAKLWVKQVNSENMNKIMKDMLK